MKRLYLLYYGLMLVLNLLPVLPLSLKGILGLIFIVISSVSFGYRDGIFTAALWAGFGFAYFFLGINVDYKYGVLSMLLGTVLYALTAYYLGSSVNKLKRKNIELEVEIKRREESEMLKKSLQENERLVDEIMKADKLKTEFFANISHELRTPLNVILGSVQLIDMYSKGDVFIENQAKITRNIAIMRQNCYRLLRLVNNLIDITRIDASSFDIHLKNHNIVGVIEDITLSVSDYVVNKGIKLVFDTDTEEKIIACDAEKIERIMLNLLSNAVKFTPRDGDIAVNVYDKGDSLCIQVKDSGIGIPADKQQNIFQRFCQIDNLLSRQHEGSGIGLNLVKSLVEMHNGTISFESEFEKGTVFTIELPAVTVSEEEGQPGPSENHDHVERIQIEFSDIYSVC